MAAHVDGTLTAEETTVAAAHVNTCASCAARFAAGQRARDAVRGRRLVVETPVALRQRVVSALDAVDAAQARPFWLREWLARPVYRVALAGALALLALVVARTLWHVPATESDVLASVVSDFRAVAADRVTLTLRTDDPLELRKFYMDHGGIEFSNSVVDLEVLGYQLIGGTVVELAKRKSTLSVYHSEHGTLVCHRVRAFDLQLPPGGEVVHGDTFYTVDGITICVHREGDVICFMASAMPRAEFIKHFSLHA